MKAQRGAVGKGEMGAVKGLGAEVKVEVGQWKAMDSTEQRSRR